MGAVFARSGVEGGVHGIEYAIVEVKVRRQLSDDDSFGSG